MTRTAMNLELVENIVTLIGEYPVSEIEVTRDGQRVYVRRPLASALPVLSGAAAATGPGIAAENMFSDDGDRFTDLASSEGAEPSALTALMVGIFHQAVPPLPYAADVRPGQIVGYIESMKLMNEVVAEAGGHVVDILVEEGAPVEYGQVLFRLAAFSG